MQELMRIFLTCQHVNNFNEVIVIDTVKCEAPYDKLCSSRTTPSINDSDKLLWVVLKIDETDEFLSNTNLIKCKLI